MMAFSLSKQKSLRAARADRKFLKLMRSIRDDAAVFERLQPIRQEYVRFACDAYWWWIDGGNAGTRPPGDPEAPDRDRILLAWAEATDAPMDRVLAALGHQAERMARL